MPDPDLFGAGGSPADLATHPMWLPRPPSAPQGPHVSPLHRFDGLVFRRRDELSDVVLADAWVSEHAIAPGA
ncbi:MAG: hypothetical protein R3F05_00300 [Planctomycetota bacterium]